MMSQTVMHVAAAVPADIFDNINTMGAKATATTKTVGVVVALVLVLVGAWKAKGGIAALLAVGIAAVFFMFILNNINNADLQKTVKDTVVPANGFVPYRDLPPPNAAGPATRLPSLPSSA